ncbi:MAG: radical SAM/SPASM domain-containing protein [Pseudomonadota bacterium]
MASKKFRLFQIEPTTRCNLNCIMCPWKDSHHQGHDIDLDFYRTLSEDFRHVEEVDLTGSGEPLMHPHLAQIVRITKAKGCRVGFSTNGLLCDASRIEQLLDAGLDWVAFSVDATTAETYEKIRVGSSFDRVIDHMEHIREIREKRSDRRPAFMIFFVMMKENYFELPDMVDLAVRVRADFLVAKNLDVIVSTANDKSRVFGLTGGDELADDVSRSIQKARQKAAKSGLNFRVYELTSKENSICEQNPLKTLFVSVDGLVSPCISLAYMNHRFFEGNKIETPVCRFGDLRKNTLQEIFDSADYVEFRRLFERRLSADFVGSIKSLLLGSAGFSGFRSPPLPPIGCRTCYYLYGI